MKVLSANLGLRENYLENAFGGEDIGACLRVNFYPKCPQPDLTLGLSPHSDPGGLTFLLPDQHVAGLQVRRNSNWITVKPAPHAFIVNIGRNSVVENHSCDNWYQIHVFKSGLREISSGTSNAELHQMVEQLEVIVDRVTQAPETGEMASILARMARLEEDYAVRHKNSMDEMELILKEKEELCEEVLLLRMALQNIVPRG
ncbi:hypothetical protein K7X08_023142 [Anisodus acutangulus]|uniref:Fe2OG dioxygenase domain-containing protein n=1 Tax=Anisodus acutangulus TaxID=402998 RepID=A0A9Q1LH20_9SOLA|nr:hypothetical protein K7X08_023142 [Anisodus acutangulus]